jgi:hypothetical protein
MTFSVSTILVGVVLVLLQVVAALPWLAAVFMTPRDWQNLKERPFSGQMLVRVGVVLLVAVALPLVFGFFVQGRDALELTGRVYGAVLQLQLIADFFVAVFLLLLAVWPKGGAVALAAFREGIRQAMFWLLVGAGFFFMLISPFLPYFTFGEDYLMVKQLGYDVIMIAAVIFGALAASMSISEEIEGRTAVTLMSKPVSRRQFLLGKFAGIALAALVIFGILGTWFQGILEYKHWFEKMDPVPPPAWLTSTLQAWSLPVMATDFLRGIGLWASMTLDVAPGLILSFSQVMVLIAIAVSLATRVPMVPNLITVAVIYFLANLAPQLVAIGQQSLAANPGSAVSQLLAFMAQLFDTVLPDLDSFRLDPALLNDTPMPPVPFMRYIGSVTLYGVLYTGIVLLFGLVLFEDRDLA